ncbi:MAG: methyltransferase domain-containing protein [Pseudomonadota bacterium]
MSDESVSGTEGYAQAADSLVERYEKRPPETVHAAVLHLFPTEPGHIIDIGAGTGRDAGYFASKAHRVLAVEPTRELRERAMALHASDLIEWLNDSLPELKAVMARGETYDLIMMNAVWMHFDKAQRETAMPNIAALARSGARVFMTLRHGPVPKNRRMFDVSGDETVALAARHGFKALMNVHTASIQPENKAAGVTWTRVVLEKL